jgi:hypothetical protein
MSRNAPITKFLAQLDWETELATLARALGQELPDKAMLRPDLINEVLEDLADKLWHSDRAGVFLNTLFMTDPRLEDILPACLVERVDKYRRAAASGT